MIKNQRLSFILIPYLLSTSFLTYLSPDYLLSNTSKNILQPLETRLCFSKVKLPRGGGVFTKTILARNALSICGKVFYSDGMVIYSLILPSSLRVVKRVSNSVKGILIETKLTSVSVLAISFTK